MKGHRYEIALLATAVTAQVTSQRQVSRKRASYRALTYPTGVVNICCYDATHHLPTTVMRFDTSMVSPRYSTDGLRKIRDEGGVVGVSRVLPNHIPQITREFSPSHVSYLGAGVLSVCES